MFVGNYRSQAEGPVVLCEFVSLCTAMGEPIADWRNVPYGIRARVTRLTDHPRLGAAYPEEKTTITSEVKIIDFAKGYIVTQNTIYMFKPLRRT